MSLRKMLERLVRASIPENVLDDIARGAIRTINGMSETAAASRGLIKIADNSNVQKLFKSNLSFSHGIDIEYISIEMAAELDRIDGIFRGDEIKIKNYIQSRQFNGFLAKQVVAKGLSHDQCTSMGRSAGSSKIR